MQKPSSGFDELKCASVTTTTPQCHKYYKYYNIIYIHLYKYISIHVHIHIHIQTYTYINYIYIYIYVYIYTSDTRCTQNYRSYHSLVKMNQGKLNRVSKEHTMSGQARSVAQRMLKSHRGRIRLVNITRKQSTLSALNTINLLQL